MVDEAVQNQPDNEAPPEVPAFNGDSTENDDSSNSAVETTMPPHQQQRQRRRTNSDDRLTDSMFFLCGIGSSICYIATLSSVVYFEMQYGANSFVYLNLAVYFPLVPIALAQARYDQEYDRQFGSFSTFLVRGVVGFGLSIVGTLMILLISSGMVPLIVAALLQGIGGSILLGTFNQMASFVSSASSSSGRLKAAVAAGVQASALVVLALTLITGFGSSGSPEMLRMFFGSVVVLEGVCFGVFLLLINYRSSVTASLLQRDNSMDMYSSVPLLDDQAETSEGPIEIASPPRSELSFQELWNETKDCCFILVITLIPSFLIGSWFTHVKTNWMVLPQMLFYTRIGADFLGRLATIVIPPTSIQTLSQKSLLRLIPVAIFFFNASGIPTPSNISDGLSVILVAIIAFLSGYLVTGCFQLAPLQLSDELRQANAAKQTSLLNVAFALAAFSGLMSSFSLVAFGF